MQIHHAMQLLQSVEKQNQLDEELLQLGPVCHLHQVPVDGRGMQLGTIPVLQKYTSLKREFIPHAYQEVHVDLSTSG